MVALPTMATASDGGMHTVTGATIGTFCVRHTLKLAFVAVPSLQHGPGDAEAAGQRDHTSKHEIHLLWEPSAVNPWQP
jgi:hypothetical protein